MPEHELVDPERLLRAAALGERGGHVVLDDADVRDHRHRAVRVQRRACGVERVRERQAGVREPMCVLRA